MKKPFLLLHLLAQMEQIADGGRVPRVFQVHLTDEPLWKEEEVWVPGVLFSSLSVSLNVCLIFSDIVVLLPPAALVQPQGCQCPLCSTVSCRDFPPLVSRE